MEQDYSSKQEEKVGIIEYISKGHQIPAITKYLFSDFIVNEIDKNQQVVALAERPSQAKETPKQQANYDMTPEFRSQIIKLLGEEVAASIEKLYEQLDSGEKVNWQFTLEKDLDKSERLNVHTFVRQRLIQIESTTLEGGKLRLRYNKNLRKMNPNGRHKYTYFKLYKHGIDTFNAIFRLSKILGVNNRLFSTAGLKDKRGHTTQLVSIYNTDLLTLKKFYKQSDRNRELWIAQFEEFKDQKIEVGGLYGNQFGLILRIINPDDEKYLSERVESLKQFGMINYFGLQRFGQFSVKTYELGAMVIRKEWKELIESILLSDCGNFNANNLKRELYQSKKYHNAQKLLHNKYKIEKLIFKALQKQGESYMNVFETLPRSIRALYTHALQSYIWNRIVSKRLRQHGLKLVVNDLVGVKVNKKEQKQLPKQQQEEEIIQQLAEEQVDDDEQLQTILIDQKNIGNFTIHDLVAPLYGPNSTVPQQSILFTYIQQQLYALNLKNEDFVENSKLYCFKGQFRKMIIKPNKLQYKILKHKNPKDELLSPFYMLQNEPLPNYQQGQLRSLQLIIQLPKSSYATMAIRQILHISSEYQIQMDLNRQYERKFNEKA